MIKGVKNYIGNFFRYKKGGISYLTMIQMLVWAVLISAVFFSRMMLNFTVQDLQIEARQLQERSMKLQDENKSYTVAIEKYHKGDRLLSKATEELNMVSLHPKKIKKMTISNEMAQKYDLAKVRKRKATGRDTDPERGGLSVLLSALTSLEK